MPASHLPENTCTSITSTASSCSAYTACTSWMLNVRATRKAHPSTVTRAKEASMERGVVLSERLASSAVCVAVS